MPQAADGPRCQLLSGEILANVFVFLFVVLCVCVSVCFVGFASHFCGRDQNFCEPWRAALGARTRT